jgi:two-component system, chemotaxis family, response regulator Rcp1
MIRTQRDPFPMELMRSMHMPTDRKKVVEILLVEDSPNDAGLMREALEGGCLTSHVTWVDNGEEAMDCLRRKGNFATTPEPNLILLDLILPRKNGRELLAEIKKDAFLRRIPIVIMAPADQEEAFRIAYDLHANCCVAKPADKEEFVLTVKKIEAFWMRVARCS